MKSKKKKKGNNKALLLLLIIVAIVGVFFVTSDKKNSTKTTAQEKKAAVAEASDDVSVVDYADHKNEKMKECKNAIRDLGINIYYDNNNRLSVSCVPLASVKNGLDWERDRDLIHEVAGVDGWRKREPHFTLSLSGVNWLPEEYDCIKYSSMSNSYRKRVLIKPDKEAKKDELSDKGQYKIKIKAAKDFEYHNVKCGKDDAWIEFDLTKVTPMLEPKGEVKTSEVLPDGEVISMFDPADVDSGYDEKAELILKGIEEGDNPNKTPASTKVVTPELGKPYEVPTYLYQDDKKPYTYKILENEFEAMKQKYPNRTKTYTFHGDTIEAAQGQANLITLNCEYKLDNKKINKIEKLNRQELQDPVTGQLTDYYYDEDNTHYYKGTWTHTLTKHFWYHFHTIPSDSKIERTQKMTFTCTNKCEEIVKVEYGPPVQVDGGMCFEYRFKVSSMVNCTAKVGGDAKAPAKASSHPTCYLEPKCKHTHQAGPTDEFDICINKCDGGEFTEACSNKCYNEVYKNNGGAKAQSANYSPSDLLTETNDVAWSNMNPDISQFYYTSVVGGTAIDATHISGGHVVYNGSTANCVRGQHYKDGKKYRWCPTHDAGKIIIKNNGGKFDKQSTKHGGLTGYLGIWYYHTDYDTIWKNHKYASGEKGDGFIRAQYKGSQCPEKCNWLKSSNCDGEDYYYFDYKVSNFYTGTGTTPTPKDKRCPRMWAFNHDTGYYELRQICETYELKKADYDNNLRTYKESIEKLCSGTASCTHSTATYKVNFSYKKPNTTEVKVVDFPLTKEKEQVFSEKNTDPTPNNNPELILRYGGCYASFAAKKWYLTEWTFPGTWLPTKGKDRIYGNANPDENSFARGLVCIPQKLSDTNAAWAQYYVKALEGETLDTSKWIFKTGANGSPIVTNTSYDGYNINGTATDFGLFKWKFSINCFYALANTYCKDPPPCDGGEDPDNDPADIRSVDTKDPFLENSSTQSRVEYRKEPRKTGFNWTDQATLVKYAKAGGGYNQNPAELVTYIKGKDTFNEQYKEYEFTLDVQTLRKLREDYRESKGYNSFLTKPVYSSDGHGVSHYTSKLLRDLTSTKFNANSSKCNNASCKVIGGN